MKQHRILYNIFATALCSIVLLTGVTSCMPEDLGYQQSEGKRVVTIGTSYESPATKAEIGNDLVFSWTRGDQIAVWSGTNGTGRYYTSEAYEAGNVYEVELSGTRSNYAVYPAAIAVDDYATVTSLKVNLPAEYNISRVGDTFSPLPMIAENSENSSLKFKHLGGLLRIFVSGLPTNTSYVTVDLGKTITGIFPVHLDGGYIQADEAEGESGSSAVKFVVPSSSSVVLNIPVPVGEYPSFTFKAFNSSNKQLSSLTRAFTTPWTVRRAHGKKVEQPAVDVFEYTFTITAEDGSDNIVFPVEGGSKTFTVTSYKVSQFNPGVLIPEPWVAQFYSTESGWRNNAPSYLHPTGTSSYYISYPAYPNYPNGEASEITTTVTLTAKSNYGDSWPASVGTAENPIDLSYYDIRGKVMVEDRNTANCYVVNGPGYYKIPCVYGNAIKDGNNNPNAYSGDNFVRHDGNKIVKPWISENDIVLANAKVCWQDVSGLVADVRYELDYVYFHIPRGMSGNAVVAVYDSDGNIVWSWHIWSLHSSLIPSTGTVLVPNTNSTYGGVGSNTALPVDLGYCGGTAAPRMNLMRFKQYTSSTSDVERVVAQKGANEAHVMYYQWGRKDPMLWDTTSDVPQQYGDLLWSRNSEATPAETDLILHPNLWYVSLSRGDTQYNLWNSASRGYSQDEKVTKTVYDPCPVGFQVPNKFAFTGFTANGSTGGGATGNEVYAVGCHAVVYSQIPGVWFKANNGQGHDVFFPASSHDGTLGYPGGRYLTASADADDHDPHCLVYDWINQDTGAFGSNCIFASPFGTRSMGGCYAIRPVVEK